MPQVLILSDICDHQPHSRYIGPYVIASQLEASGFSTLVVDFFTKHPNFFEYIKKFISEETIFVGISSTFLAALFDDEHNVDIETNYWHSPLWFQSEDQARDWLAEFRKVLDEVNPNIKIIVGGGKAIINGTHIENFEDNHFNNIDYFIFGNAETVTVSVVEKLIKGEEPSHNVMNGVKIVHSSSDIDKKWCPQLNYRENWAIQHGEALPLEVSRGCIFNCKFCRYDKKQSYVKSSNSLKQELIQNYENFGTTNYLLSDDCFNDSRKKVEEVCNVFLSLPFKLNWVSYARVDVSIRFPETFKLMIESGGMGFYWGVESLNYKAARAAGKGTHPDKVKEFLKMIKRDHGHNHIVDVSLIVGLPNETEESVYETMNWVIENQCIDFLHVHELGLFPYNKNLDKTIIDFADYSRNPKKYGFTEVNFSPVYWKHNTMDFYKARELSQIFRKEWSESKYQPPISCIWEVPALLNLGYSREQVIGFIRGQSETSVPSIEEINHKFRIYISNYWNDLENANNRVSQEIRKFSESTY